jgi:hypothetical protein
VYSLRKPRRKSFKTELQEPDELREICERTLAPLPEHLAFYDNKGHGRQRGGGYWTKEEENQFKKKSIVQGKEPKGIKAKRIE